jgi:hypothetical protein
VLADGIDIRSRLTVDDLREINLSQWKLGPPSYFGSTPAWAKPEAEILRGIAQPTYDVPTILAALPSYPATDLGVQQCWAHHMALHAGCHPWPNANHRTAHRGFNLALDRLRGLFVGFHDKAVSHQLIEESHRQRDQDMGEYTHVELADAQHVYRRLFSKYAEQLVIVPVTRAGELAEFGEGPASPTS